MKRSVLLTRLLVFAMSFVTFYIGMLLVFSVVPLLLVFLAWDISILNPDWARIAFGLRMLMLLSVIPALSFTLSKEGKSLAKNLSETE